MAGDAQVAGELRLSRMRRLLRRLGDPHLGLRIIHVAGTKGKGSTAAMLAAALSASGVRTGLYCSPHLHRLEERFTIDGKPASAAELVELVDECREAVEQLEQDDPRHGERGSTFFEITTAMGLLHFARRGVGAVVLEVGMGGRLDSTNVVHPVLSIITSISFDHTRQLGNTLASIATEKAGILKRGRPAVSGVRDVEARQAIRRVADSGDARCTSWARISGTKPSRPSRPWSAPPPGSSTARTWRTDWGTLELAAARAPPGPQRGGRPGGARSCWPRSSRAWPSAAMTSSAGSPRCGGRPGSRSSVEDPWLVIDGAHNAASAAALAETLRTCFPPARRTLSSAPPATKDLEGQLQALLPCFDDVIATRYVENPRSVPPEDDRRGCIFELTGHSVRTTADPAEALELARRSTAADGLICVTGSLFLAAEARAIVLPHAALADPLGCRDLQDQETPRIARQTLDGRKTRENNHEHRILAAGRCDLGFPGRVDGRLRRAWAEGSIQSLGEQFGGLAAERLEANFQTAAQYHMYCALAILAVGMLAATGRGGTALQVAGWSFLLGSLDLFREPVRPGRDGNPMAGRDHADRRRRHAGRLAGAGGGGGIEFEANSRLDELSPSSQFNSPMRRNPLHYAPVAAWTDC